MKCDGCGNEKAIFIKTYFDNNYGVDVNGEKIKSQMKEMCEKCGLVVTKGTADVFFRKEYFDQNLGDEKHPEGQWITSKAHKAKIMREQNVREKGDRVHGSRLDYRRPNF